MPDITSTLPKPGVTIIIAKKQAPPVRFDFPDQLPSNDARKKLIDDLEGLGLHSTKDYLELYQNGQLSQNGIDDLRTTLAKDGFPKRQCQPKLDPEIPFPNLMNPGNSIEEIKARVEEKINKNESFKYRDSADVKLDDVPDEMEDLADRVEERLESLEDKNPNNKGKNGKDKTVNPQDVQGYITSKETKDELLAVAKVGKRTGIIYHEPHHDLTPGILWLDQIFRALASQVGSYVAAINAATPSNGQPNLTELQEFVGKLGGYGGVNDFTSFILQGGEQPKGLPYPVDPTRVELFLEGNHIDCVAVIVGAWAGGTHSAGHT